MIPSLKKPKAKTAIEVFGTDRRQDIQDGTALLTGNALVHWKKVRNDLWDSLDSEQQEKYEALAEAEKAKYSKPPPPAEIYEYVFCAMKFQLTLNFFVRNQDVLVGLVENQLRPLIGWNWGQCGDVVFYVQIGFRDEENHVRTSKFVSAFYFSE